MKRVLTVISLSVLSVNAVFSQCEVTGSANPVDIVCGDCSSLTAFGRGQGQQVFGDNFNTGAFSPGWGSTQQALWNNPCSPGGVDGTTHVWMGNSGPVPRFIATQSYDLTPATSGVTICFDMMFAPQTGDPATAPCEGPDEPGEGVHLQYNTGSGWVDIHYFNPNGGSDPQLINWNNWCFPLPAVAITTQTQIRFYQDLDSGADYDHWGIDNFVIYYNDPNYHITWLHDNYDYGLGVSGGVDPTPVCPRTTVSYIVRMTNNIFTCYDTVSVAVTNPVVTVSAGPDTTVCAGECATLHGTAKVVKKPAKTPTYRNGEVAPLTGLPDSSTIASFLPCFSFTGCTCPDGSTVPFFGMCPAQSYTGVLAMDINITDLNTAVIQDGELTRICIESIAMLIGDLSPFQISLVCPSGAEILLADSGDVVGTTITNACFDLTSTNPISSGTAPYTGAWRPVEPLTNLSGCTANGVWTLKLSGIFTFGSGSSPIPPVGFFNGWNISFDDPEISYVADFTWSPTTNMTNANTLTPTVCPPSTQTYTLTAQDTAGCVIVNDDVLVTVTPPCCNLDFTASSAQPSCGAADGSITITVNSGSGNYTFLLNGNPTTQTTNALPSGIYTVSVIDITQSCQRDTVITLTAPGSPVMDSVNVTHETCLGDADGTATAYGSGGTGTLTYSWSTSQTGQSIINIPAGNHSVSVTDINGCVDVEAFTINPGAVCCSLQIVQVDTTSETCAGNNDGAASVTISGATGTPTYAWSGTAQTGSSVTGLSPGIHYVTVTDGGCTVTDTFTIAAGPVCCPLQIVTIDTTSETCAGDNDGTASLTIIGVTGTPAFAWSGTSQTTQSVTGLSPGMQIVTVTDGSACTATDTFTIDPGSNCCVLQVADSVVNPHCGQADGAIFLTITGSGNYTFSWSNSLTTQDISNLFAGSYTVTVHDVTQGCDDTTTINLSNSNANSPVVDTVMATPEICRGDNNGTATVSASGGNGALSYAWTNSTQTTTTITGLAPGNYSVTVSDTLGCQAIGSVIVPVGPVCCNLQSSASKTDASCNAADGSITITVVPSSGTAPFQYSIDSINFVATNQFNGLASGTYYPSAKDADGCKDVDTITVAEANNTIVLALQSTPITCFGDDDGTAFADTSGGNPPLTIQWSNNSSSNTIINLAPGKYKVTVSDQTGCQRVDSVTILEPSKVTVSINGVLDICAGDSTVLDAGSFAQYRWSTLDSAQTITVNQAGNYSVTVYANGCPGADTVTVTVNSLPSVDIGIDSTIIYDFEEVPILTSVSGTVNPSGFSWNPNSTLSCNCQNPIASPDSTTWYYVTYIDNNGCSDIDSVLINVLSGEYYAMVPNAFSPNGDNINDVLNVYNEGVKNLVFRIFNRWGSLIFETHDLNTGWDGTFRGKRLDPDVFVFELYAEFYNYNIKAQRTKGSVALLR